MTAKLLPGQSLPLDLRTADGRIVLQVRVDRHHDGVAFTVAHHRNLSQGFTDLAQGRAYLRFLMAEASAGRTPWEIEMGAGALISTIG